MGEQSIIDPIEEPAEPLSAMRLEALVPRMSSPVLRGAADDARSADSAATWTTDVPVTAVVPWVESARSVGLELGLVAGVAAIAGFLAGDARVGILAVSLGIATTGLRRVDRVLPFSIGEGFIGYHPDDGWPHGVQEDDDVRWNWRPATAAAASATATTSADRYS